MYIPWELGVSRNFLGKDFYVKVMNSERIIIHWCFGPNPSLPSFGYFFVPSPLQDPKLVPEEVFGLTDSIDNFSIDIYRVQKWYFFKGVSTCDLAKTDKILKSGFLICLCPHSPRELGVSRSCLGNDFYVKMMN